MTSTVTRRDFLKIGGLAAGGPISGSIILALLGYPDPLSFSRGFIVCSVFVMVALFLVLLFVREPKHIHVTAVEPRRIAVNDLPAIAAIATGRAIAEIPALAFFEDEAVLQCVLHIHALDGVGAAAYLERGETVSRGLSGDFDVGWRKLARQRQRLADDGGPGPDPLLCRPPWGFTVEPAATRLLCC